MARSTVNAVQMFRGQTRNFTFGHATMNVRNVRISPGHALVINRGRQTTFVKCGTRKISSVRIISLMIGQTVIVKC